jgi:hypothetical protein
MGVFLFRKEAKPNICVLLGKLNTFSGKNFSFVRLQAPQKNELGWAGHGSGLIRFRFTSSGLGPKY